MSSRQNTKYSSATYGVQPRSSKGSNPSSQREIVNKKIKLENMRKNFNTFRLQEREDQLVLF